MHLKKFCSTPTSWPKDRNISAWETSRSAPIIGCSRIPPIWKATKSYTIQVKNLETGELLPDRIANTYYTLEWANDNRTFFYTVLDETKRPYRAFRHELGAASDTLVYQEDDGRFTLGLAKTRSRRFVFIELSSPLTSELRYLEAADPLRRISRDAAAAAGRRI